MKTSMGVFLGISLLAVGCGSGGGGNDPPVPDAGGGGGTPDGMPPPADGFQIVTTPITIPAGGESTWCYFFQTPNTAELGITRWESQMTPGSHHMITYFTSQPLGTPGTVAEGCGGTLDQIWTYASQQPTQTFSMPAGIGMAVQPRQYGFIEMHYLNASDEPLQANVTLNGVAHAPGVNYVKAGAYVTFNTQIRLDPGSAASPSLGSASGSCAVAPGSKFFTMSTHAHRRATRTQVHNGDSLVFSSTDWEHPGTMDWRAEPFFQFSSGRLTYSCDYANTDPVTVRTGNSAQTDEMCMAVGYFFPANRPVLCVNDTVILQ